MLRILIFLILMISPIIGNAMQAPKLTSMFGHRNQSEGTRLILLCSTIEGSKPLLFQWSKDGTVIKSNPESNYKIDNFEQHSTLTIPKVYRNDSANYTCITNNAFGSDRQSVLLSIKDPSSSPILRVVSVTAHSILLSWIINFDDSTPATEFILYHKEESKDWQELRLTHNITKSYTHESLRCGTRYQYYLIAFNSVGKNDSSSIVSAKTEGTPPVAPDTNSFLRVNTSTATISLNAFHDGGCTINMFEVLFKLQKSGKWISLSNRLIPNQKLIVLSCLIPSTLYDLRIIAYNEAGSTEACYSFTTSSAASQDLMKTSTSGGINQYLISLDFQLIIRFLILYLISYVSYLFESRRKL